MRCAEVIARLKAQANPKSVVGMARFGISAQRALGVAAPVLRKLAKEIGRDHALASELWDSGLHEAHILATLVDDPKQVTSAQMERWVSELDSWDVCDALGMNLLADHKLAAGKAAAWSARPEEFVKRAGFVIMAELALKKHKTSDEVLLAFLPVIRREAGDGRNFVKKAVSWALRAIGKRNAVLNRRAVKTAQEIAKQGSASARWIATGALRELKSEAVQARFTQDDCG